MLTMGSLFDGIGGFPLAAVRNGIVPVWASEIEAFPIEVTKIRFPEMLHVGDITKLNGATLPPVDVICGGSPCQDLSVAGARRGLAGERSGLFMEQTRIAKEMRKADESRGTPAHLVRPRYLVWENVPGAFSSAEGEDFRAVIEEIIRIKDSACDVPRPDTGRWESAGLAILGTEFSLAWRVLDAQYWGVAQRRRRIFLVADFAGRTAPEILFKQDSLFGDIAPCGGPWQGAAAPTEGGADDTGRACLTPWDVPVCATSAEVAGRFAPAHLTGGNQFPPFQQSTGLLNSHALRGGLEKAAVAFAANQRDEVRDLNDIAGALGAQPGMKQQTFVADATAVQAFHVNQRDEVIDLHGLSGALLATRNMQMQTFVTEPLICLNDHGGQRMDITEEFIPTLRAGMGGHAPLIAQPNCLNNLDTQQSRVFTPDGIVPTLAGAEGGGQAGQGYPCVLTAAFIPSAGVAAQSIGYQDECSPTIKTSNAPAVLCLNDQGGSVMSCSEDVVGTLRAQEHGHQPLVFDNHAQDSRFTGPVDVSKTVSAGFGMGGDVCDRSLWEMKGAIRSGSGQNLVSESEQQILGTTTGNNLPLIMATQQGGAEIGAGICPTITASAGMSGNNQPVLFENHPKDGRYNGPLAVAPTLAARMGTGGNNVPLVGSAVAFSLDSKESNSMKSQNPHSGCRETDLARTIDTTNPCPSKNQGGIAILQEAICIAGNTIDRQPQNGGNGLGCQSDIAYTLTATDHHAVFNRQGFSAFCESEVAGTQCARQHKDATDLITTYQEVVGALCSGDEKGIGNQYVSQDKCIVQPEVFGQSQFGNYAEGCTTLRAQGGDNGGGSENLAVTKSKTTRNLIRRLTPLECERLQGFPDGWTLIPSASDSARYKALGNSVAIPCVEFIMRGIAYFLSQIKGEPFLYTEKKTEP